MKFSNLTKALFVTLFVTAGFAACTEQEEIGTSSQAVTALPPVYESHPTIGDLDELGLKDLERIPNGCRPTGNMQCMGPISCDDKGKNCTCYACNQMLCTVNLCGGGRCSAVQQYTTGGICDPHAEVQVQQ